MPDKTTITFLEKKHKKNSASQTCTVRRVQTAEWKMWTDQVSLSLSLSLSLCPNQLVGNYRHFLFQISFIFCPFLKYGFIFEKISLRRDACHKTHRQRFLPCSIICMRKILLESKADVVCGTLLLVLPVSHPPLLWYAATSRWAGIRGDVGESVASEKRQSATSTANICLG